MAMLNNQRVQESLYLKIGTLVSGIDFPEKNQSIDEVVTELVESLPAENKSMLMYLLEHLYK